MPLLTDAKFDSRIFLEGRRRCAPIWRELHFPTLSSVEAPIDSDTDAGHTGARVAGL